MAQVFAPVKRYKIVTDGNAANTIVYDPDGKPLPLVRRVEIVIDCSFPQRCNARIELLDVEVDAQIIDCATEVHKVDLPKGQYHASDLPARPV